MMASISALEALMQAWRAARDAGDLMSEANRGRFKLIIDSWYMIIKKAPWNDERWAESEMVLSSSNSSRLSLLSWTSLDHFASSDCTCMALSTVS